jgi:hypothetical protein
MLEDLPLFNQSDLSGLAVIEPLPRNEIPLLDEETYQNKTQQCSMFADELFPTPDEVIELMIKPFLSQKEYASRYGLRLWGISEIFDPSAGKGSMFEYLEQYFVHKEHHKDFVACEIEQDLRYVLSEKGYSVIGSDWLEFDEPRQFEFILMNPPFSNGAAHLLKAWEHCAPDGDVTCLLNAETVKNPYTTDRKKLKALIDCYGSTEFLGQAFQRSERPTDVEVVIVRLHKPDSATRMEFEGVQFQQDTPIDFEGFNQTPLAKRDVIKTLVEHYKRAREILVRRYQVQAELNFCLTGTVEDSYSSDEIFRIKYDLLKQLAALKARFWKTLFEKSEVGKLTTSGFQRDFTSFERSQKEMAFTEANILEVLELFFMNRTEIMQNCILEVFDKFTENHENCLGEGWKTNSAYQINKKIIFPYAVRYDKYFGFRLDYGWRNDLLCDLDKVLMYINGDRDICYISEALDRRFQGFHKTPSSDLESSYFRIRYFKKGTVHLWFLDKALWEEFNRRAAIGKKWIGAEESSFTNSQKRWNAA